MRPQERKKEFVPLEGQFRCRAEELLFRFFSAPHQKSFRECYIEITGDSKVTGRIQDCNSARFREALGTVSWPDVFSASVARQMVNEYSGRSNYEVWRKFVDATPNVLDFRTHTRVRIGGYGDLPTVNEGSPYLALPSPPEESAAYALAKRGGTEAITLEMIKNDDVGAIRRIPKRLAEAAHRTLAHFVLDFLRVNPTVYDGISLFHTARGNLGSGALSASQLNAARTAMMRHVELGSGDPLGLKPRFLLVPFDLQETAYNLFVRGTNQDRTFVQNLDVEVVPIWYWTDANDWCVAADPAESPTIEIGFLDGKEEPELFTEELPSVGSMFSNDQTTFKIRHIYGGAVIDYRGLYKSVVA